MKNFEKGAFLLVLIIVFVFGCKKSKINKAPVANAGLTETIQLPIDFVTLSGSGKDEDGTIVAYLWSQISGPNNPSIQAAGSPATKVTGLVTGTYHFQLKVIDNSGATGVDSVSITVLAAINKVPSASAGNSAVITLPTDVVTLSGSGSDTDGTIVAYLWSQVSGPFSSQIDNPGAASTQIRGLKEGKYVFQLMVTDNHGATGVDTSSVTVNPNPIKTLTLQPANNPNEIRLATQFGLNYSGPGPDLFAAWWTSGGDLYAVRSVFKFDLSGIPANATISSASLYLYSYPPPTISGNQNDANFGTTNSFVIQQVTSNWSPGTVSWFNQPTVTAANQVIVPHTNLTMLDLNLDVKNIVASMVSSSTNYGFCMKLQNEVIYNSRIFVSSNNTQYPDKHPKLVIVYQ